MKRMSHYSLLRPWLVGVAAAAVMTIAAGCQESIAEKAAKEAKTYTSRNCPVKLSDEILIDSLTFDAATQTFRYYYTLSGRLDTLMTAEQQEQIRESLRHELKNTTSMKAYKDEGYSFGYTYHSAKNRDDMLIDLLFTKTDYQ